jgi:O-antigen ligase
MKVKKIISVLYQSLFFIVPLVLFPSTSELFEFNKMVVVYLLTTAVAASWTIRCVLEKKIIFKKTPLDIPILIFLGSQIISTLISIDPRTSLLGYYSRFNGGLISLVCYFILYWGFVSNFEKKDVPTMFKLILSATFLSSFYGILEHFGIDKNVWIQDVQNRVFSSFGQPNWMAAWLAAIIPMSLSLALYTKTQARWKSIVYLLLSVIIFITLLFTKSRSGILGLLTAMFSFWGFIIITQLKNKSIIKQLAISSLIFLVLAFIIGTPWTPNISEIIKKSSSMVSLQNTPTGTALEVGGTSSVEIRKIVWQGAIDVWKNYPLFGSGVETFAFSYYQFRPTGHNLVSEWDFLYNKAHNEYLNFMATTGTVGIISYAVLIVATCLVFLKQIIFKNISGRWYINIKNSSDESENKPLHIALFSGYLSILVTNFFGFSVVPVNLLFYLFPAMTVVLNTNSDETKDNKTKEQKLSSVQKTAIIATSFVATLLIYSIFRYWFADILYSKADIQAKEGKLIDSVQSISSAIKLSPREAIYHDELGSRLSDIALVYLNQKDENGAKHFSEKAFEEIAKAESLSPNNLNILRNKARVAIRLSEIDPVYILDAKKALEKSIQMAPTEAKLYYNLSLTYYRIGDIAKTIDVLKKTIELKANYKDARYAYAAILSDMDETDQAIEQLKYILDNIDPNDSRVQSELEKLENSAK